MVPLLEADLKTEAELENSQFKAHKPILNLNSCLEEFFEKEKIEYRCESCDNTESYMYTVIDSFPEILVLHLKRFQTLYKKNKLIQKKIIKFVNFDQILEIGSNKYGLFGIVNHMGEINSGHYTCYGFNKSIDKWYSFNDHEVSEVSSLSDMKSSENYIFYYKKILN